MKTAPEKRTGAVFLTVNAALVAYVSDLGVILGFHCLPPAGTELVAAYFQIFRGACLII